MIPFPDCPSCGSPTFGARSYLRASAVPAALRPDGRYLEIIRWVCTADAAHTGETTGAADEVTP